jgi:2-dehydro-3-deoxygluconokinase
VFNILAFGEILIRVPIDLAGFDSKKEIYWGGAEVNTLCALSRLNNRARLITKVPNNKIGSFALDNLEKYQIDTSFIAKGGDRIGLYYYASPQYYTQGEVVYDRQNSSVHTLKKEEINKEKLMENIDVFYVSGISLALENCRKVITDLWDYAKNNNIKVAFDVNYRSKLWSIKEAKPFLAKFIKESDILFANEFDFKNFLDLENVNEESLYKEVISKYGVSYIATLKRQKISYNEYEIYGILATPQNFLTTPTYKTAIIERIGGGDCFVAGILQGIFNKEKDIANKAVKLVLMKYSMLGDVYLGNLENYQDNLLNKGDVKR